MRKFIYLVVKTLFSFLFWAWFLVSTIITLFVSIPVWVLFYYDKKFNYLSFSLFVFSILLKFGIFPLGWLYAHFYIFLFWEDIKHKILRYYNDVIQVNDTSYNVYMSYLFNDILLKEKSNIKFGDVGDKFSYIIMKNYYDKTLKLFVEFIVRLFNPLFKK